MPDEPPEVEMVEEQLKAAGFTPDTGVSRFKKTIKEYSDMLFKRAVSLAEADRDPTLPREINHQHVASAAYSIANRFGRPPRPKWAIPAQVAEYMGLLIAGIGGGHLDKPGGIWAFGGGLAVFVILIGIRLTRTQ